MGSKKHKRKDRKKKHHKKEKKHKRASSDSDSSSTGSEEWVEKTSDSTSTNPKTANNSATREEWMSPLESLFTIDPSDDSRSKKKHSKEEQRQSKQDDGKYKPEYNPRELNPYWKQNGTGLPTFKKPTWESDAGKSSKSDSRQDTASYMRPSTSSGWKKDQTSRKSDALSSSSNKESSDSDIQLTDEQINQLGAKLIKAEILGNTELVNELKTRIENARANRIETKITKDEGVVLTTSDAKGNVRPLVKHTNESTSKPLKSSKRRLETHLNGERIRFFDDDDKHSLKQMFEQEKFGATRTDFDEEFVRLSSSAKQSEDLDDVYIDNARKIQRKHDEKTELKERDKAIKQHKTMAKSLDNCHKCIDGLKEQNQLLIEMNDHAYLRIAHHQPLTAFHCQIIPIKHASCTVQLDENVWDEVQNLRKKYVRMCRQLDLVAVFFETAVNLNKYPHMAINCVALEQEPGALVAMYFKKAILECEKEWSMNKKLVDLKLKNVRSAIPKGMSYFFVDIEMNNGYAHVIEDQREFPRHFAEEIIAGLLDLDHSSWRKPRKLSNDEQIKEAKKFLKNWKEVN